MGIVVTVEDMQHFEHDSMWRKVNGEDLPIAEVHFNESCQKKFYTIHSNFPHNKKTVSESNEMNFPLNLQGLLQNRLTEVGKNNF